jgi:phosphoribosylanthranilate isomerase
LAGGLNSDTVAEAVQQINPYALDVSSGVESAKGVKDIDKIKQFYFHNTFLISFIFYFFTIK